MADTPEVNRETVYELLFECTSTDDTLPIKIPFPSPPRTVTDIKRQVQTVCQIPVSLQNILLNLTPLDDNLDLNTIGLRKEDTLTVKYYSTADCNALDRIIKWLRTLVHALKKNNVAGPRIMSPEIYRILNNNNDDLLTDLAFNLFLPWMKPQKHSNKIYFVDNNGLDLILELYTILLSCPWDKLHEEFQAKSCEILCCLWNLAETFELRREMIKRGGLEKCIQGLLQASLEERESGTTLDILLSENVRSAIGTLANLCELPETHITVASNEKAMKELTNICTLGFFDIMCVQSVSILLLVLSYSPSTHPYLLKWKCIESLVRIKYAKEQQTLYLAVTESPLLLNYHRATFFAQMCLISYQHFTSEQIDIVGSHLSQFIPSTTPQEVCTAEIKGEYVWETFLPYVKVFYLSSTPCNLPNYGDAIYRDSLCVNLMALQNMLSRPDLLEVLLKENLLDFVTCIPWHVPIELRERATELVNMIGSSPDMQLSPPSLVVITKAVVARMYCSLEEVIELSVPELIRKLVC